MSVVRHTETEMPAIKDGGRPLDKWCEEMKKREGFVERGARVHL